jgi:hypothetical protein
MRKALLDSLHGLYISDARDDILLPQLKGPPTSDLFVSSW